MKLEESFIKVAIILLFGFAIGGFFGYYFGYDVGLERVGDGSSVGRVPPSCQFAPCP